MRREWRHYNNFLTFSLWIQQFCVDILKSLFSFNPLSTSKAVNLVFYSMTQSLIHSHDLFVLQILFLFYWIFLFCFVCLMYFLFEVFYNRPRLRIELVNGWHDIRIVQLEFVLYFAWFSWFILLWLFHCAEGLFITLSLVFVCCIIKMFSHSWTEIVFQIIYSTFQKVDASGHRICWFPTTSDGFSSDHKLSQNL